MRPYKDAKRHSRCRTIFISGLSTCFLFSQQATGPLAASFAIRLTDNRQDPPENVIGKSMATIGQLYDRRRTQILARERDTHTNHADTIRAVAPEYGQMRSSCAWILPYRVREWPGVRMLLRSRNHGPRVVRHCVSENCVRSSSRP